MPCVACKDETMNLKCLNDMLTSLYFVLIQVRFVLNNINIVHSEFKETLTTLKYIYTVKGNSYLYSAKSFFPYLMLDIIITSYADIMSSLCPTRLLT